MKIPALNDSQYIGMNVYNVVIMSIIVVVLSNILSHQPTLAYVMESSFMLLSTTVTLCLLFLPKVRPRQKSKTKVQGVPQSQTAALYRHQEEAETDKTKQAQIEQTYEKH